MFDRLNTILLATVLVILAAAAAPSGASAQPFIDFGRSFHVRLTNGAANSGSDYVGTNRLYFSAFIIEGQGGSVTIEMTQGKSKIVSFGCRARGYGRWNTICNSENFPAANIDASRPVEITVTHVNDTTDAQTVLYQATLPVYRFWSWSGNDARGKPRHVEQRGLRLDGALGLATIRQGVTYITDHPRDREEFDASYVTVSYWDATPSLRGVSMKLRCRVGEGEWTAVRISGPVGAGDAQEVPNRVRTASGQVHEGEGQSVYFQRKEFTANFPFQVAGTLEAPREDSAATDGTWTCELRSGEGTNRRVERTLRFEVKGGEVLGHRATDGLRLPRGTVAIGVGFSVDASPESFDPSEIERGFFGVPWGAEVSAPVIGDLPSARAPQLTSPPGVAAPKPRKVR
jgi:hypothetical protein